MCPVFNLLVGKLGETVGWYFGLVVYWFVWGAAFSFLLVGKDKISLIIRPQKLNKSVILLVLFPLVMALVYKVVSRTEYNKPSVWIFLLYLSTALGNGFFEEVLWRGVYMDLFPDNLLFGIVWPSIWFSLWHYVPGSVSSDGNVIGLMIGSVFFGFYLSFLAKKTGTIWWPILAHVLGEFIMIL
jgi:membrane protease YdiL (CAAX protease family)